VGPAVGLLALMALAAAAVAQDAGTRAKLRSGRDVLVAANETVPHDLYVTGGTLEIDGRVEGDLVASGGQVTITGSVIGDVLAAGGTVTVSGDVGGDLRVASGQATVSGQVGEDLALGAGRGTLTRGGQVGEDLLFSAGEMTLDGAVAGDVLGATGTYRNRGSVAGQEDVRVEPPADRAPPSLTARILDALGLYVSILALGALLLWLVPRPVAGAADEVVRRPLPSLGIGLALLIGIPIAALMLIAIAILLAILLGLLGLGALSVLLVSTALTTALVLAFVLFVGASYGAQIVVGLVLGRLVLGRDDAYVRRLAALALGLLVIVVVSFVPFLNVLAGVLVVLFGLGGIALALAPARTRPDSEPVAETPPART
jgi:hypothetical protein